MHLRAIHVALTLALVFAGKDGLASDDSKLPDSAVRIQYERTDKGDIVTGHGTAFGVNLSSYGFDGNRYLLSVSHNVLDRDGRAFGTLKVELSDGKHMFWTPCKVIASDPKVDICLLEADEDIKELAELATKDAIPGEPVTMEGSPRGIPVTKFAGTLVERFHDGSVTSLARIDFDHGDSGGPLFSMTSRKVVGIAVAGIPKGGDLDHTVGLFIPVTGIESFLESNRRKPAFRQPIVVAEAPVRKPEAIQKVEEPVQKPVAVQKIAEPVQKPKATPPVEVAAVEETPAVVSFVMPTPEPAAAKKETPAVAVVKQPAQAVPNAQPPVKPVAQQEKSAQPVTVAASDTKSRQSYVIQTGDTLSQVAKRFNIKLADLVELNGIKDPNRIIVGTKLVLSR